MLDFLKDLFQSAEAHQALLGAALVWLWHHFAGTKADAIAERVKEVAQTAFTMTVAAANAGHVDPTAFLLAAKQRARTMLDRLGIPFKDDIAALLDHELDLVAAEFARAHMTDQLAELGDAADDVVKTFETARREGEANPLIPRDRVELVTDAPPPPTSGATP